MLDSSNLQPSDRNKLTREAFLAVITIIGLAIVYMEWETSRLDRAKVNAEIEAHDVAAERDELAAEVEELRDELDQQGDDDGLIRGGGGGTGTEGETDEAGDPEEGSTGSDGDDNDAAALDGEFLTLSETVIREECNWRDGGATIAGESFESAITCETPSYFYYETHVGHLEFMVPAEASQMRVIAGLDDDSEDSTATLSFAIYDSSDFDLALGQVELGYAQAEELVVNVEDVVRVRLGIGLEDLGVRNQTVSVAWAEPHFE